jgi:hypothetical protein
MNAMIHQRGKREQINRNVPNMEQRTLLPRSEDVIRCSVLGFESEEQENELLLSRLAALIVEAYLYTKRQSKE